MFLTLIPRRMTIIVKHEDERKSTEHSPTDTVAHVMETAYADLPLIKIVESKETQNIGCLTL